MATVTPNFNWPVPTSTDLVRDGATAIEALGDSIDGSLVDLKGGTTGQVLSKTSGTDMDFTWVTTDDANAIQNSIVDAKGDLISATANDTPARLAVGANGETLVADSSTSTGLRYQGSIAAGRNFLINGGQDVWQRGTSFSGAQYTSDRWFMSSSGGTLAASRSTDVPTSPYFQYSLSVTGTSANNTQIYQRIESANSTLFAGQTVTLSVWAKNSAGTTSLDYVGLYPTATDNFASTTLDIQGSLTATSWSGSWTRYSVTFTANALATRGYMIIFYRNGTETSTTLFTGAQLEIASVRTNFSRAGGTIQGELAACQRYFQLITGGGELFGAFYLTTAAMLNTSFPVQMRVAPTPTYNTTFTNAVDQVGVANRTPTSYVGAYVGTNGICILAPGITGATIGNPAVYIGGNHQLSAEL